MEYGSVSDASAEGPAPRRRRAPARASVVRQVRSETPPVRHRLSGGPPTATAATGPAATSTHFTHGLRRHWTPREVQELRQRRQQAGVYRWMHGQTATYYREWAKWVALPAYLLHVLATGSALTTLQQNGNIWVASVTTLVCLLGLVLKAVDDYVEFAKQEHKHKAAAEGFSDLGREITRELNKPEWERRDCNQFLEYVDERYSALKKTTDTIPQHIMERFERGQTQLTVDQIVARVLMLQQQQPQLSPRSDTSPPVAGAAATTTPATPTAAVAAVAAGAGGTTGMVAGTTKPTDEAAMVGDTASLATQGRVSSRRALADADHTVVPMQALQQQHQQQQYQGKAPSASAHNNRRQESVSSGNEGSLVDLTDRVPRRLLPMGTSPLMPHYDTRSRTESAAGSDTRSDGRGGDSTHTQDEVGSEDDDGGDEPPLMQSPAARTGLAFGFPSQRLGMLELDRPALVRAAAPVITTTATTQDTPLSQGGAAAAAAQQKLRNFQRPLSIGTPMTANTRVTTPASAALPPSTVDL